MLDLDLRLMCSYRDVVVGGIDLSLKGFRWCVRGFVNGQSIETFRCSARQRLGVLVDESRAYVEGCYLFQVKYVERRTK